jgi:hypothetical protein
MCLVDVPKTRAWAIVRKTRLNPRLSRAILLMPNPGEKLHVAVADNFNSIIAVWWGRWLLRLRALRWDRNRGNHHYHFDRLASHRAALTPPSWPSACQLWNLNKSLKGPCLSSRRQPALALPGRIVGQFGEVLTHERGYLWNRVASFSNNLTAGCPDLDTNRSKRRGLAMVRSGPLCGENMIMVVLLFGLITNRRHGFAVLWTVIFSGNWFRLRDDHANSPFLGAYLLRCHRLVWPSKQSGRLCGPARRSR